MYFLLGSDGREYGPATPDRVRQWIGEGRAGAQTPMRLDGSTAWKPLSAFPECAGWTPPPPLAAPAPQWAAGPAPSRNHPLAVAGFICGVLGLVCCGPLLGLIGLVLSLVGLVEINRQPGLYDGRALAIAGLVLSGLSLLVTALALMAGLGEDLFRHLRGSTHWWSA
jgi:hypothetical protein